MSHEDELAAKGQLLEDYTRTNERVTTIAAPLDRQSSQLQNVGLYIKQIVHPNQYQKSAPSASAPWSELTSYEEIQELIVEYKAEHAKLQGLIDCLRKLGLPA